MGKVKLGHLSSRIELLMILMQEKKKKQGIPSCPSSHGNKDSRKKIKSKFRMQGEPRQSGLPFLLKGDEVKLRSSYEILTKGR